jgi:hypothetical protein
MLLQATGTMWANRVPGSTGWFSFQPLLQRLVKEEPDLFD